MTKNTPTPRQRDIVRKRRAFGERLREWFHDRESAATARRAERRAQGTPATGGRGIDRIPTHLSDGNPLQRSPRPTTSSTRQQRRQAERTAIPVQFGDQSTPTYPTVRSRPPRRRDMPGAQARRLVRARKAWLAGHDGGRS